jgi:hypothetical protein
MWRFRRHPEVPLACRIGNNLPTFADENAWQRHARLSMVEHDGVARHRVRIRSDARFCIDGYPNVFVSRMCSTPPGGPATQARVGG